MYFSNFQDAIAHATAALMQRGEEVNTGHWQGYKFTNDPSLVTIELLNLMMEVPVDRGDVDKGWDLMKLQQEIRPNLPWADDHFAERVSRVPSNPGLEYKNWPWWRGQEAVTSAIETVVGDEACSVCESDQWYSDGTYMHILHKPTCSHYEDMPVFRFTHTYQERFWPKFAGRNQGPYEYTDDGNKGIRYEYGDLDDVVNLLFEHPFTRQATFPIFFPEDTGAVHGGRIPCTLHYHFMLRGDPPRLNLWYPIRSCDLVRHFRDDLYMACRLMLWVLEELVNFELRGDSSQLWVDARPGTLFFTAYSFHAHKGDLHHVRH